MIIGALEQADRPRWIELWRQYLEFATARALYDRVARHSGYIRSEYPI